MNRQGFYIAYIGQEEKISSESINVFASSAPPLNLKRKDGSPSFRKVGIIETLLLCVLGYRRMMYAGYLRMIVKVMHHLQRIFYMALPPGGKVSVPAKAKGMKRGERCSISRSVIALNFVTNAAPGAASENTTPW